MRIIRPFCKTVFYAFLQILAGLQLIAKPLLMGSGSPVQRKYAFMRCGVCAAGMGR